MEIATKHMECWTKSIALEDDFVPFYTNNHNS